ncbi:MAG: 3-dehydroquinate synthase [Prevotellaceae bacterium]|nr:3-dehydroquinate synthase [Prevotellaceae bacterium]
MKEQIINAKKLKDTLNVVTGRKQYDKVFVITDTNTARLCLPLLSDFEATNITIGTTDANKSIESLTYVLQQLVEHHASRHSLLLNLGGGVVTDLGGFAAATFKRGIDYANIPTTLLAMVDAAVGGKTSINFGGLKNEVGVFKAPVSVLINTVFLKTLDNSELYSGFAEVLKHALLNDKAMWSKVMNTEIADGKLNINDWQQLVYENVKVKSRYVEEDPLEQGIRKALNFGHTFGHAFESFSFTQEPSQALKHGYAVAHGMICELYLSVVKLGFPQDIMRQTVTYIKENYSRLTLECKDYDSLIELMYHDKKNSNGKIRPVLLRNIGVPEIDITITEGEVKEAFDFYREA